MLIGAIENVLPDRVMGWIHCHSADLRGATVLAYVDRRCVGSGRVENFRQDLADAGLLHGHLGFDFPISLETPEDAGRVVVSLERCEAIILQRGSVVTPACDSPPADRLVSGQMPSRDVAAWLQKQGAISSAEFDFLESLIDFGVAIWRPEEDSSGERAKLPLAAAGRLFSICALSEMSVGQLDIVDEQHLQEELGAAEGPLSTAGLLAFHAAQPVRLWVQEGSHKQAAGAVLGDPATNGLEYPVSPDSLLVIHRSCRVAADECTKNRRLRVLFPLVEDAS